jgi:hypothetical protein
MLKMMLKRISLLLPNRQTAAENEPVYGVKAADTK